MKSAYELALEKMERDGIKRPQDDSLSEQVKAKVADVRRRAEAKLAELEILHHKAAAGVGGEEAAQNERNYWRERERVERDRDREVELLRRKP